MSELIVSEKGIKISEEKPQGNCWLRHKWTKWTVFYDEKVSAWHVIRQRRECLRCGKTEISEQRV
jgi:hypothetical protein